MQETKTRAPAEESPTPRPSWVRVVALLAAVALLGGALFATWQAVAGNDTNNPGGNTDGGTEPDFSLTDEQAIARFEELDELRVEAYRNADIGLVSDFAGPGPFKDSVVNEIRGLKRDDIFARLLLTTEEIDVTTNQSDRVVLRQIVIFDVQFIDEKGNDVTRGGGEERFTVNWTLEPFSDKWLISESDAIDVERL
jgi:hypothetical protein